MKLPGFKLHIRKNGRLFGFGVSPNADWKIIFVTFALLLVGACTFGVFFFLDTYKGDINPGITADELGFKEDLLRRTVLIYQERESRFLSIKSAPVAPPDPSL